jgi:hypothetical protein
MQIIDYKYLHGTEQRPGYIAIPELSRLRPAAPQFAEIANLDIRLTRSTAFLYIDGFSLSPSECGLHPKDIKNFCPAIKTGIGNVVHSWIRTFENNHLLSRVDIMSGTCAAGIQAIYEAEQILARREAEEVIIIGGERITDDTMRLFKELNIPITCGDGFVYVRAIRGNQIEDCKWKYQYHTNPFGFTAATLNSLIPSYKIDYVKLHATGTESNTAAEKDLEELATPIQYKETIGHTQGVSALLETCMVLDDPDINGTILVTANGMGGFYGAFTLTKCT